MTLKCRKAIKVLFLYFDLCPFRGGLLVWFMVFNATFNNISVKS